MDLRLRTIAAYGLSLVTPPAEEPVTRAEAKKQCEVATAITAHDSHFDRLIKMARIRAEELTGRQLVTATWDLFLDAFPADGVSRLQIPRAPLASVTHVKYIDAGGTQQTLDSSLYKVVTAREPGEIHPAYGTVWPIAREEPDAVEIRFVAGYGDAADVPELLKEAMLLLIGHWFEHREEVVGNLQTKQIEVAAASIFEQHKFGDEFAVYSGGSPHTRSNR